MALLQKEGVRKGDSENLGVIFRAEHLRRSTQKKVKGGRAGIFGEHCRKCRRNHSHKNQEYERGRMIGEGMNPYILTGKGVTG